MGRSFVPTRRAGDSVLAMPTRRLKLALCAAACAIGFALANTPVTVAQQSAHPGTTPRAAAPADLTGYWAAVITEDWRFRMVTAAKGEAAGVPLNDDGEKAA